MAHLHLKEVKSTQRSKVQGMVGHAEGYNHPAERAETFAKQTGPYFENRKLDPPEVPDGEKVGP